MSSASKTTPGRRPQRRITATRDDLSGAVTKAVEELTLDGELSPSTPGYNSTVTTLTGHVVKKYAGCSKKGYAPYNPRKQNQDSMVMVEDKKTGALFLATLDGHGEAGDLVSQHFTKRLPNELFTHSSWPSNPGKAMTEVLAKLEDMVIKNATIDTEFSGTTAVLATIIGDTLTVCNVGDSRIICGTESADKKAGVESVSEDHKPDDPVEKARIVRAGGRVFAVAYDDGVDGPARVWLGHMDIPGLAMSRSLGDTIAHTAGVSSEPDIYTRKLTKKDKFLVLATDGLWEFITNEEVAKMTRDHSSNPDKACEIMAAEAHKRWMKEEGVVDDTTIIVAFL